jgi:transcriptional regulator with XRE-family HTH domain
MNPIRNIRTNLFRLSQSDFAALIGRTQASVSRWESGGPFTNEDMAAIRTAASNRNLEWSDRLFFEVVEEVAP